MIRAENRPFPITAYSAVNGLGSATHEVFDRLFAGECGLSPSPAEFGVETWCGRIMAALPSLPSHSLALDTRQARMCGLALQDLLEPAQAAVQRWGARRVAVLLGTSTGGIAESEAVVAAMHRGESIPLSFSVQRQHALDAVLTLIRRSIGAQGPGYVVSTACSSSAKIFGNALRLLRHNRVDAVLLGGVDTLCHLTLRGFAALEVLSRAPTRPFSRQRQGINIGEGGAFVLVEREGAAKLGLFGSGESSDAHHMTAPHPQGNGAYAAMQAALDDAGLSASVIDHVNAHGTASQQNDAAESLAIGRLFGRQKPVVATKGATGHLLGAAGATEVVFALEALVRQMRPPSVGADPLDDSLDVQVATVATPMQHPFVISNSLAFGGSNAAVIVGRWS